jgi:hypothetical protein
MKTKKLAGIALAAALIAAMTGCAEGGAATPAQSSVPTETYSQSEGSPAGAADGTEISSTQKTLARDSSLEDCKHRMTRISLPWFETGYEDEVGIFDNKAMTLSGIPEFMPIKIFDNFFDGNGMYLNNDPKTLEEMGFYWHTCTFEKNGAVISDGYVEEGMTVKIYHSDYLGNKKFYGEYTVQKLSEVKNEPLFYMGASVDSCVLDRKQCLYVKKGISIENITEYLNEIEIKSAKELGHDYVDIAYYVLKDGKEVAVGAFEKGMVLRSDSTGWIENWEKVNGQKYDEKQFGKRFNDYIVAFV